MNSPILGLHHVTAIAGDPQINVDFYVGVLGLRLIKKTVNFDDPSTYHLYYGDGVGSPGTVMTFFPWPGARRGTLGSGQTSATAFAVPKHSLDFWRQRFEESLVRADGIERFGVPGLAFSDPDGLRLELLASAQLGVGREPWDGSSVPAEHAIRGFDGVTLLHADSDMTERLLVDAMGFRRVVADGRRVRFESGDGGSGTFVDLLNDPGATSGRVACGSVHHIAFRLADDDAQAGWQHRLFEAGHPTTEVKDRMYFHSIYFREPGGVLFELATDNPGFATDESVEELGSGLRLPPWFESARDRIEKSLPALEQPGDRKAGEAA
ncbi:MAG: ring-cleaving dioxygenase [Acidobacteria bacterium]|jgi:glyoxalase family protein|nr:ring-cleaving dioxygenase [Acidobacteriota bacterium]